MNLVKIKKNVFGLATSPHEWWNDLRGGIFNIEIGIPQAGLEAKFKFEQCPLDPCVFTLRKWKEWNVLRGADRLHWMSCR